MPDGKNILPCYRKLLPPGSRQYFSLSFAYDGSVTKMTRLINVVVRPGGIW
jgi:hypothetical protein